MNYSFLFMVCTKFCVQSPINNISNTCISHFLPDENKFTFGFVELKNNQYYFIYKGFTKIDKQQILKDKKIKND